jgi:predicted RNA-binding protein
MNYPKFKNEDYIGLNGTSEHQLLHPHFEKWQKWLLEEYMPPKDKVALFIPCAAIKPYYNSPIHKIMNETLSEFEEKIHKIVISNAGVIPYEFADKYPFNSYDWNPLAESENMKKRYYTVTKNRIWAYLSKHSYNGYASYLRLNSISFACLNDAMKDLNLNLNYNSLNEFIDPDKDTDLILTYQDNLDVLKITLGEIL